jgi:hypothetical protein
MVIADALARHGQYGDAAGVLLGAVEKDPDNAEAWLALGNALVGHAEGTLTPPALYAYRRAARPRPSIPVRPSFLGLALAQSGLASRKRARSGPTCLPVRDACRCTVARTILRSGWPSSMRSSRAGRSGAALIALGPRCRHASPCC